MSRISHGFFSSSSVKLVTTFCCVYRMVTIRRYARNDVQMERVRPKHVMVYARLGLSLVSDIYHNSAVHILIK